VEGPGLAWFDKLTMRALNLSLSKDAFSAFAAARRQTLLSRKQVATDKAKREKDHV